MQEDFSEIMNRLTENARFALQKADQYAKKFNKGYMGTEHLLVGILAQDNSTGARLLLEEGVTLHAAETALGGNPEELVGSDMAMMSLSEATVLSLRIAQNFTNSFGIKEIGTEHILYALLTQNNSRAHVLLEKNFKIDFEHLVDSIEELVEKQSEEAKISAEKRRYKSSQPSLRFLNRFGTNLTKEAKDGRLDAVIGRDQEIERVITILCRRTKSNPVLIGEAGVGKTAIVEGLASRIAKNDVPSNLVGKHIYEIDLSSVVAGTKFRGEFEERLKGIIDEAVDNPDIILFIDEIHLLSGAGSSEGTMDAANILKPALARGTISLIGATTLDEYRKNIEKDKALARRFESVIVNEPTNEVTLRILKGVKKYYENHHHVSIPDSILETAITMSNRYINDRFMPDKALDVLDEASAIAKVAADKSDGGKLKKMKIERGALIEKIDAAAEKEDFESAALLKTQLVNLENELKKLEKTVKKSNEDENKDPVVTEENLATAISLKTGIPVSKVHDSEQKLLLNLEKHLKKSIIGQDEAIDVVAKAIRRGRSGIANPRRPIGSFLFMGPTGVGKTELARVLAREVFGGENSLIKIDMSEFSEKHNVSRLVGAPAGYIGYDDGGKLTEAVRRHPYSVVLFDEIEKADPEVFNILLQILEDGTLTDGQGTKVKFNNTIIILTSNLGSRDMADDNSFGFDTGDRLSKKAAYEENKTAALRAMKKTMRPELINRLDSILVFHPLTRQNVEMIFDNLISELKTRLSQKNLGLSLDDAAKNYFIEIGFDAKNGARPLRRAIEDHLESLLSEAILKGDLKKGDIAEITYSRKKLNLKIGHE